MTASSSPLNWRGLLGSWFSTLRITRASSGSTGVEIVQAAAGNRPVIRPFSNEGETDIDLDIYGLGSGTARVNGAVPVSGATFTAKGDLLGGTGVSAYDNLAVGTDGQVLTADSGQTTGLAWTTPATVITDHGGLTGLVDDDHTHYLLASGTRALTGNLDLGGFYITGLLRLRDTNGNIVCDFTPITTAVNYVALQNNVTGSAPRMTFTGSDTNIDGVLATKGTGRVRVRYSGTNYEVATIDLAQTITNKTFAAGSGNTIDAALLTSGTVPIARVPLGSTSSTVCVGDDPRLSDARTPSAHSTSHKDGGSDEVATTTAAAGAIPKAGSDAKLGESWIPEAAHHDYAHYGTSNYEAWFAAGCTNSIAMTSGTPTADRLYAFPFVAPSRAGATVDRLGLNVTAGASGNCRIGIYTDSNGYPDALVVDSGAISTTSAVVVTATISQALTPGRRYWMAAVFSAAPTVRTLSINSCSHALGTSNALGTASNVGLYVSYSYAALPGTFPGTPTMVTAAPVPALFYRFSA